MAMLSGSSVTVTDDCAFVGPHLVRRLLDDGVRTVVVVDSLRYGESMPSQANQRVGRVRH